MNLPLSYLRGCLLTRPCTTPPLQSSHPDMTCKKESVVIIVAGAGKSSLINAQAKT